MAVGSPIPRGVVSPFSDATGGKASPLTTKGDLYGRDTADNRLPVGIDGQVLKASAAAAMGVAWSSDPILSGLASTVYVNNLATGGAGTSGNPWTGWETALNALPIDSRIHFPKGAYTQATMITMKRGWRVTGDGADTSVVTSAFTGTAFRTNFAVNGSSRAYVTVRDLGIVNTNAANVGSGLLDVFGGFVTFSDVHVQGFKFGICLNGTEIGMIMRPVIEFQNTGGAGIWIVNGGDYNLTNADIDYSTAAQFFTNLLTICGAQVNEATHTAIAIADDGGYNHWITGNNINAGTNALRIAGINCGTFENNECEGVTGDVILVTSTTFQSGASVGPVQNLEISGNTLAAAAAKLCVRITSAERVLIENNLLSCPSSSPVDGVGMNTVILGDNIVTPAADVVNSMPAHLAELSKAGLRLGNVPLRVVPANGVARAGTATLIGGTKTVANTSVTATTIVMLSRNTPGGTVGTLSAPDAGKTPGTSFVINSSSAIDTSTVDWFLIDTA